jgi:hypothetical protein
MVSHWKFWKEIDDDKAVIKIILLIAPRMEMDREINGGKSI